ncbi:MAG: hypothetical protein R3271_14315 [Methylophaga sp.]|uniref:hypothetical protein n=1 Tax=Methylophaga sp. TaxID=2024840 RepID=UPI00299EE795|nr:hypothetical protein [Methylophaga sp.]MDX1751479.1 hypothetical protein [Methylophaga sp.]
MADEKNVNVDNSVSFTDYLGIHKFPNGEMAVAYDDLAPEKQRVIAVACALEVVRAGSYGSGPSGVKAQMDRLSSFADQIQAALKG